LKTFSKAGKDFKQNEDFQESQNQWLKVQQEK